MNRVKWEMRLNCGGPGCFPNTGAAESQDRFVKQLVLNGEIYTCIRNL